MMHLHTDYGIAVSAQKDGLLPISQQAMFALASLAYHDYEGLALNEEEKPRLVADLGDKTHHDSAKPWIADMAAPRPKLSCRMFLLERACKIQILAQSGGGELVRIPEPIFDLVESQVKAVTVGQGAALTWPGLLRKLDRVDPSYRDIRGCRGDRITENEIIKIPGSGFTVKSHFEGKDPAVRQIYDRLLKARGKVRPGCGRAEEDFNSFDQQDGLCGRRHAQDRDRPHDQERSRALKSAHSQIRTDFSEAISSRSQTNLAGRSRC